MKIAIVRLSAFGDIIHSMIVLQFLKKHFPASQIDWYVSGKFAEILQNVKHIDNVHRVDLDIKNGIKGILQIYKELKKLKVNKGYDIVIDLQGLIKSAVISKFINSKRRVGFDSKSSKEFLSSVFYNESYRIPYTKNIILRNIELIESAFKIKINKGEIDKKEPFFEDKKYVIEDDYIVFILGASFPSKIYPVDKLSILAGNIEKKIYAVYHSNEEKKMAEELSQISNNVEIYHSKNFNDLLKIIRSALLVVGGDTGPTHLAWGLNRPSITLFGSTPMDRNCYHTKTNLALSSGDKINPFKIDKACDSIKNIEPSDISEAVQKILAN